jgi:hypothetical protein
VLTATRYAHRKGCPAHAPIKYQGKDFKGKHHWKYFNDQGWVSKPKQLEKGREEGFRPPGQPKRVGSGKLAWPHFG